MDGNFDGDVGCEIVYDFNKILWLDIPRNVSPRPLEYEKFLSGRRRCLFWTRWLGHDVIMEFALYNCGETIWVIGACYWQCCWCSVIFILQQIKWLKFLELEAHFPRRPCREVHWKKLSKSFWRAFMRAFASSISHAIVTAQWLRFCLVIASSRIKKYLNSLRSRSIQ